MNAHLALQKAMVAAFRSAPAVTALVPAANILDQKKTKAAAPFESFMSTMCMFLVLNDTIPKFLGLTKAVKLWTDQIASAKHHTVWSMHSLQCSIDWLFGLV